MTEDAPRFDARQLEYALPEAQIAQAPLAERDAARLLCMRRGERATSHRVVRELPELLPPSSLLVLNDTRVIPARLLGEKPSGGRVEVLLVERLPPAQESTPQRQRWRALTKGLRPGQRAQLGDGALQAELLEQDELGARVELCADEGVDAAIARVGRVPLPPYIERAADEHDAARYQTVYAAHDGAVAAPTAGLHFTEALLGRLRAAGHQLAQLTLHVGPGTFAPLRSDDLDAHVMHQERYSIPEPTAAAVARARSEGRAVLAVGTTVMRALESAADEQGALRAGEGRTALFIRPPYAFRAVDALLTNFHLPRSTLLALVMAFGGVEPVRHAYAEAVAQGYRFFSYGDAMLLLPAGAAAPGGGAR
jgi:S-adenosylmethionine:tRNA ribosyltransferase-isomerase